MQVVLDSSAAIAFLRNEEGAEKVQEWIAENEVHMHAVNLCEVYYHTLRHLGEVAAEQTIAILQAIGITFDHDTSLSLLRSAGRVKAQGGIALGDVFAVALAKRLGGPVLTSDRSEYSRLAADGTCRVEFFR